jgi:hypothetical protein
MFVKVFLSLYAINRYSNLTTLCGFICNISLLEANILLLLCKIFVIYKIYNIPEDYHLHTHLRENLKSHDIAQHSADETLNFI